MKIGDTVTIHRHPISKQDIEGEAVLLEIYNRQTESVGVDTFLYKCLVRFLGESAPTCRYILADGNVIV